MNAIKQLRLKSEKKMLTEEIEAEIASFDSQIEELSSKKIMLEFEMKLAEMLLITTYQELIIIEAFEAKD